VPGPPDGIVNLLIEDHRSVEQRLASFPAPSEDRMAQFRRLVEELVRHEVAEELVVYPALRKLPGGDQLADARIAEQSEAEARLARMERLDHAYPEFMGEFAQLRTEVLAHAKSEEAEVFPVLNAGYDGTTLVELGQKYLQAKLTAPTHPHPHAPDTPPGNKLMGPVAALIDRLRDAARTV
jgi:hemerythrin superfamily protein